MCLAKTKATEFVVITGGEPTVHGNLNSFAKRLAKHLPIHLETSGAYPFDDVFEWVTVSPKIGSRDDVLDASLLAADEVKVIVETPEDIARWVTRIERKVSVGAEVWLHPEWSQRNNFVVLDAISEAVQSGTYNIPLRAGYQLHKLYKVDALDPRSAIPVPLGGNLAKGY